MEQLEDILKRVAGKCERWADDICITRLSFELVVFFEDFIDEIPDEIIHFYKSALEVCEGGYTFYTTETMRRPRKVDGQVLEMVPFLVSDHRAS